MDNKYDRQERLWSASGQESLKQSHIAVLGVSIATLEAAKGLILAGIGSLTIVRGPNEEPNTLHLFSTETDQLRQQLNTLNCDAVVDVVQRVNEVTSPVSLVIQSCSQKYEESDLLNRFNAPIFIVGSHMLEGFVRIVLSEHTILQPHPETGIADLRTGSSSLDQWPELRKYCDQFQLSELNDVDHAHVPYNVLLVKAYSPGMTLRELKDSLANMARSSLEENFEEAIKYARVALRPEVTSGIRELVRFREEHKAQDKSPFWLLVGALDEFIKDHKVLPVSGEVPDMISSTENFVTLKRIYAARFQEDTQEMASYLPAGTQVPLPYLHAFCKNVRYLKYIEKNEGPAHIQEEEKLCRNHPSREIYPVAAFIGGVAAQEATKVVMNQYMPMIGVLIYDAGKGELIAKDTDQYTVIDAEKP